MQQIGRYILCAFLLCLSCLQAKAVETECDTLVASLLTCSPGDETYELYGHTAIRIRNTKSGEDLVFNYGMFSFKKPHFIWRFMMGQTDYELGVVPYDYFADSYIRHERSIDEQVLNLKSDEAARLYVSLLTNYLPEYRTYRYNFLYDNCTTRAIEQIEKCLTEGEVVYPAVPQTTFRSIINEFAGVSPWNAFGANILIGREVDEPIGLKEEMFSPMLASKYIGKAVIQSAGGSRRSLVVSENKLSAPASNTIEPLAITPDIAAVIFLLIVAGTSVFCIKRHRAYWAIDVPLMVLQGGAGCIIALLFFFSDHPAVGSNALVAWLNPLPLLYLPIMVWRSLKNKKDYYHVAAGVVLALFLLLSPFYGQKYPTAIIIVCVAYLLRSLTVCYLMYKNKK